MAMALAVVPMSSVESRYPRSHIGSSFSRKDGLKLKTTFSRSQKKSPVKCVASAHSTAVMEKPASATSLYSLLGLEQDVSLPEIKVAFRKLALKYHPDVCPALQREESTRMFVQVQDAYEQLSDPQRRQQYDYELMCQNSWSQLGRRSDNLSGSWKSQWEQQLENFQRRKAEAQTSESWGARMRRANAKQ